MLKKLVAGAASCLLCLGLLAGLTGCQETPAPVSSDAGPDLVSVPPPLSIDMTTLITAEQASQAVGAEVAGPEVYEDGTWLHFASEDAQTTVDVHLNETTRELYDTQIGLVKESYGDGWEEAPNLGETALWLPEYQELLVYTEGYMLDVSVDIPEEGAEAALVAARQIAALILEKL